MKVDAGAIAADVDCRCDLHGPVGDAVVVEIIFGAIRSRRKPSDGRAHHALAVILERGHVAPQRRQSVFRCELEQTLLAAFDRHALGQQVAFALHGRAHIRENQIEQCAVDAAAAHQQHRRNADSLLINLARQRHGSRTHAADVSVVRAVRHEERRLAGALHEYGGDCGDIGQVGAAAERIVQNRDVARLEIEGLRRVLDRERHGAQMHGHVIAHRDGFASGIVHGAGIIAALLDVCRVRSLAQHRAHFFGDGNQQMAKQLQFDGIGFHSFGHSLQMAMFTRKLAVFCHRLLSDFSMT